MKLTFIFLCVIGLSNIYGLSYAQQAKLDLKIRQTTVREVLREIEKQSEFSFMYDENNVDVKREVKNLEFTKANIDNVLDFLFDEGDVKYQIVDRHIILLPNLSNESPLKAQQKGITVTGVVTDDKGEPLPGVNVYEKANPQHGVITGINGSYSITVKDQETILFFSFIGFDDQELNVAGREKIDVIMVSESTGIDEVIVTALGVRRRDKTIGYVTQKVDGKDIVLANESNVVRSLSGKLAGVQITNPNQLDGGSSRIVIRGNNSISGNNQPLYIIDGIPLDNNPPINIANNGVTENTSSVTDYGTSVNFLNQDDIEDFRVLKGPAAAALYGARGANGVILITTKKGSKKEGVGIDYSFRYKVTDPYRFREQQNVYGYGGPAMAMYTADNDLLYEKDEDGNTLYPRQKWNGDRYEGIYGKMPHGMWSFDSQAFTWHGYSTSWGRKMDGKMIKWWDGEMRPHSPQPNNQEYFYKNGIQKTHNISFSNAGEYGSVRVAIGHDKNDAIIDNSNYERTSFSLGSNLNISDQLNAELTAAYNDYTRLNGMNVSATNDFFTKLVYNYPVDYRPELDKKGYKREDGSKNNHNNNPYGQSGYNVFWNLYEQNRTQERNQFLGALKLVYSPTSWLSFMGRAGLDFNVQEVEEINKPTDVAGLNGYYYHGLTKESVSNFDFLATANKDNVLDNLDMSFSLGGTRWDRELYGMNGRSGKVFKDPWIYAFQNYDLSKQGGVVQSNQVPKENRWHKRINSVYGFLDLHYSDYLFLQITGRNDWSSTLPSNNNSYFYPSTSMSFIFSEFMENSSWLSFGKLRLAYAEAAQDTDPYQLLPTFSSNSFAGFPTHSVKSGLPPIELKPQNSRSYEAGVDIRLFESRLKMDFTYYHRISDNQIMSAPIPVSSGFNSVTFNTGELENKGFEVIASYDVIKQPDLNWIVGLNGARNRSKLLALDGVNEHIIIGKFFGGAGPVIQVDVGEEYGNIYGWDYELNEKGNRIVETRLDGDGNVVGTLYKTTDDRVKIGNSTPDIIGGFSNTLRWKNFNLYALVDFSLGADIWSGDYATSLSSGLSPSTLYERNGNGLPYTYPDGTKANHGILMEGDLEDGSPNTHVVHYIWKYGRLGSWGGGNLTTPSVLKNDWVKLREVTLSYNVPTSIVKKTKVFQSANIAITGRDLFYIYSSLPDRLNPEATSLTAGNAQGLMFGALPGMRSFTFSVNVSF